jgi:hypothetical protein
MDIDDDETPSDILVYGCAYTPLYGDDEPSTIFKDVDMNNEFAETVKGLPVYIEHDTTKQIGEVYDAFINEKRQLMTLLHLNNNPIANKLLPPTLYKDPNNNERYYNALSLGNDARIFKRDEYAPPEMGQNTPAEVSLVMAGNRPMTEIDDYWLLPKQMPIDQFMKDNVYPSIVKHY